MIEHFPSAELYRYATYLKEHSYGTPDFTCDDYPRLLALMSHDKKNDTPDHINFTLLSAPGSPLIDRTADNTPYHRSPRHIPRPHAIITSYYM